MTAPLKATWLLGASIAAALSFSAGEVRAAPAGALKVVTAPSAPSKATKGRLVSPYARAAASRNGAAQITAGHSPTAVQGMGHPRRARSGAAK